MDPTRTILSMFPFLTATEFHRACAAFNARVHAAGGPEVVGWLAVRWSQEVNARRESPSILRVSKYTTNATTSDLPEKTHRPLDATDVEEAHQDLLEDDDYEALIRGPNFDQDCPLQVDYDIVLSPGYQVPILFFTFPAIRQVGPSAMDTVYRYLVPHRHELSLKSFGVMGGLSFGYHPESGLPAYFIHPCNTASAMSNIVGDRDVDPEDYLLIWLGLVGNCVNLSVPSRLLAESDASFLHK